MTHIQAKAKSFIIVVMNKNKIIFDQPSIIFISSVVDIVWWCINFELITSALKKIFTLKIAQNHWHSK